MPKIKREQLLLLVLVGVIILGGLGLLIWQNINNKVIIAGMGPLEEKEKGIEINKDSDVKEVEEKREEIIVIHIAGEVKKSGVYELAEDSRVIDAIMAAGGETEKADLDRLNLAAPIFDGDKIYVPSFIDESPGPGDLPAYGHQENTAAGDGRINLNRASSEELQELPGIGPSKADSIIEYRKEHGGFSEINELIEVNGIGEKTLENLKDKLTLR